MVHIKITKGLDIPIQGQPKGMPQLLIPGGEATPLVAPHLIALDLTSFEELKFKVLVSVGEHVKLGQPLVEDKNCPGRFFVAPAGGVIHEIRRGLKRRLLDIIIAVDAQEEKEQHPIVTIQQLSREELIEHLKRGGLFTRIRQRPFNTLANPLQKPKSIFVKALESAPFVPSAEMQVNGYEKEFQAGLDALTKLTEGPVHLVYYSQTTAWAFQEAKNVSRHTAEGPHPIANSSLHIQRIDPIQAIDEVVWTMDAHTVVAIGFFLLHGSYFVSRIVSLAGPGILEERTGYFKLREGYPLAPLLAGRLQKGPVRLISGDPLMGHQVEMEDFLGYNDKTFCAIPENTKREFLHFFRLGLDKYTFSGTYLSGHFKLDRLYPFTTSQHGEHRPFIDSTLYDQVMPLSLSTVHLVRAVLADDLDEALELGLLEVDSEDFALPTFVCPSKMEMTNIMKEGLSRYAKIY